MFPVVTSISSVVDTLTQWAGARRPGIELAALLPAAGVTLGLRTGLLRPGEIKPRVSGFPLGSADPVAGTQQSAWPTVGNTLTGVFSASFCCPPDCACVAGDPAIQRHTVYGLKQPTVP